MTKMTKTHAVQPTASSARRLRRVAGLGMVVALGLGLTGGTMAGAAGVAGAGAPGGVVRVDDVPSLGGLPATAARSSIVDFTVTVTNVGPQATDSANIGISSVGTFAKVAILSGPCAPTSPRPSGTTQAIGCPNLHLAAGASVTIRLRGLTALAPGSAGTVTVTVTDLADGVPSNNVATATVIGA